MLQYSAFRGQNVTFLLITLTRGPLGYLVFLHAREVEYVSKTGSLNSVATVKLTFFRVILELSLSLFL